MKEIIAIGGPHGSGKSSVAKKIAELLNYDYVSAGEVFRQIAKERNVSMEKMSQLVLEEPALDRQIDERTRNLGSNNKTVVDAQLAAYFTPNDTPIKICITAPFEVRCERIAKREKISVGLAIQETKVREESERKRFIELYNIDINDNSVYDIIINNTRIDENKTLELTMEIIKNFIKI